LLSLASFNPRPWLCVSDFNEILNLSEKISGATKSNCQMEEFKNALDDSQLSELGFRGPKFTWNNGRTGNGFTNERLDPAVANMEWCEIYGEAEVIVLVGRSSDHNPLCISLFMPRDNRWKKCHNFRVEASWAMHTVYKAIVKKTWKESPKQGNIWGIVQGKHQRCQQTLQRWGLNK
jgi:hypothetical protein